MNHRDMAEALIEHIHDQCEDDNHNWKQPEHQAMAITAIAHALLALLDKEE